MPLGERGRLALVAALLLVCSGAWAAQRFPPPEFDSDYSIPTSRLPQARSDWLELADLGVLVAALCTAAWLAVGRRSRTGMAWLSAFCLAYFGFYRGGCVCPIGAVQNVALGLWDSSYAVPFTVAAFFALPLLFALLFGRVFCGGVCPLGAIQDLVLIKPVRLPLWLREALSLGPFVYLGVAVLYAATDTMFIICRYDPFVGLFRLAGPFHMLVMGAGFVLASVFIGRPYCRFVCPYGALLGLFSRWAWRKVSVTPDVCVACSLCQDACPFDAIQRPTPEGVTDQT